MRSHDLSPPPELAPGGLQLTRGRGGVSLDWVVVAADAYLSRTTGGGDPGCRAGIERSNAGRPRLGADVKGGAAGYHLTDSCGVVAAVSLEALEDRRNGVGGAGHEQATGCLRVAKERPRGGGQVRCETHVI